MDTEVGAVTQLELFAFCFECGILCIMFNSFSVLSIVMFNSFSVLSIVSSLLH